MTVQNQSLIRNVGPPMLRASDNDTRHPYMSIRINSDSRVMIGKPVIAGTRITVELILEKLRSGERVDQILSAHPRLTREGIDAALAFAAAASNSTGVS